MLISKGNPQAYPELRKELRGMRYPAFIEPKIDGELNWLRWHGGAHLINKSGKIRSSCPITEELNKMKPDYNLPLLGELYWGDGKACALYEFLKHQDDDDLKFMVFDVDMPGPYLERRIWLIEHISPMPHVWLVDASKAMTEDDVQPNYDFYVKGQHYEGIVVKSADSRLIMGISPWVKMKKKDNLDLMVVKIDPTLERIEVQVPVNAVQVMAFGKKLTHTCGVKVMNKIKATLKVGDIVEIEHQGILSKGGLRHPVFVRRREDKCVPVK